MTTGQSEPRKLTDHNGRERARLVRDRQWRFMEKAAKFGTVWHIAYTRWREPKEDEEHVAYLGHEELYGWFREKHPDWLIVGAFDEQRKGYPVTLSAAGYAALENREQYDMEPVFGGLVEPGWQAIPLEREAA